ncbi:MAG TPA: AAA family ATPase [Ornithinicoccus sp.]|nr:AAA family ATPase [Ornithinicoccus sp.]
MVKPYDVAAETALLSDMLNLPDIVAEVSTALTAGDFFHQDAQIAFAAMVDAWRQGRQHDGASISAVLREAGRDPDPAWLADLVSSGTGAWRSHIDTIVRHRARRQITAALTEAQQGVGTPGMDPFAVIDRLQAHLTGVQAPAGKPSEDLYQLDEFIDQPEHQEAEWVVPGLLRRGWRVVVVATEGAGKSMLWRQFAVLAAQGLHPLEYRPIPKCRTLLIDLENPDDAITGSCRKIRATIDQDDYEPGRAWIWHRPGGFDLRSRALRAEFEANLALVRPDLVCLGPLYKAYQRKANEQDEQASAEVQATLDDLRTRYGFALLLEHHAPQAQGDQRHLRPYGSSLWLRWPEIGIAMRREFPDSDDRSVTLERWRGDRMTNEWPKRLEQGVRLPWVAA